ncbi:hypothetical protein UFOVP4_31 [uncultured Caudovirales phage]|uniref:Uncharacterized protein n=1 Tax=uncultured Caudovirales phage TaxID=2100421 RepID=A0A6J5TAP7_9CAUD|nr:hypothetical protein UFOVP4_31 [uncultured Caudovirales phage]CAB4241279.1 hypothetical protein UFOVP64_29 [uncultured Caudovirales phage]CAB5079002.1 hypothetical protein UFOVP145_43 [uncultured Caudovirales phage]
MTMINNTLDQIDSRDINELIEELDELLALHEESQTGDKDPEPFEHQTELDQLKALAEEGADYADDWHYGAQLVRDSYFKQHAMELAEDCGMIKPDATWPHTCIDWDRAARELRCDYTSIDFGGVTYWVR